MVQYTQVLEEEKISKKPEKKKAVFVDTHATVKKSF
jgi:hypothetical protein